MMRLFTFLFILGITNLLSAQDYTAQLATAKSAYDAGKYKEAGQAYAKAFRWHSPRTEELHLAVSAWALAGKKKQAFATLEEGINSGWIIPSLLLNDPSLESLTEELEWKVLTERLMQYSLGSQPELRKQMASLQERDQYYRKQMEEQARSLGWGNSLVRELQALQKEVDSMNLVKLDTILQKYGYPGRSLVGPQASTAYLVIQHADLATQEKYLPLLREAAANNELPKSDLALLEDRIRLRKDEPQLYGSQVIRGSDGKPTFYRIENPEKVDERRRMMDLPPLKEYAARFGILIK